MKLGPCCWGTVVSLVVMATGPSRLDHSMLTHPAPARPQRLPSGSQVLSGESLYQLESVWTSDRGQHLRLRELGGSTQVLAMVFTRCPTLCPTLVHDLKAMDAGMKAEARRGTHFVLVTIDPEHDTPKALREFRAHMGLDPNRWTLLCGKDSDTRELAAVLGFAYGKGDGRSYTHSNLVTVLDRGGVIVHQQAGINSDPMRALAAIENTQAR